MAGRAQARAGAQHPEASRRTARFSLFYQETGLKNNPDTEFLFSSGGGTAWRRHGAAWRQRPPPHLVASSEPSLLCCVSEVIGAKGRHQPRQRPQSRRISLSSSRGKPSKQHGMAGYVVCENALLHAGCGLAYVIFQGGRNHRGRSPRKTPKPPRPRPKRESMGAWNPIQNRHDDYNTKLMFQSKAAKGKRKPAGLLY